MDEIEKKLAEFGRWALLEHRENDCNDLDGASIQDHAEKLGLLVRVRVTEPCGKDCVCVDYDDFPLDCLRLAKGVSHG